MAAQVRHKSMNPKSQLRHELRQRRKNINPQQKKRAEHRTHAALSRFIKRGKRIALYWALGSELCLHRLAHTAQQRHAQLYLPYIETGKQRLWFTPYPSQRPHPRSFSTHPFRIPQFKGKKIRAHQLHTLLLPLIGIDKQGFRLGQGGGFYDVSLAHCQHRHQPQTIGIGFTCQYTETVFPEPHDSRLKYFVSEQGIKVFTP